MPRPRSWIWLCLLLLAASSAASAAELTALPATLPGGGRTIVEWRTLGRGVGVVRVSRDGGREVDLARGERGSVADVLPAGSHHVYRLYREQNGQMIAGPVEVRAPEGAR